MMEPVVEVEVLPVEGAVIQVEGEADLGGEQIDGVPVKIVQIREGVHEVGRRGVDHEGIVNCVDGVVGLLKADALNGEIEAGKEPCPETGIDEFIEHPCS